MTNNFQCDRVANRVVILSIVMLLAACSEGKNAPNLDPEKNAGDVWYAASGMLDDLNLRREEIPPLLKTAMKDPYAMPSHFECSTVKDELVQLDAMLGADVESSGEPLTALISYDESKPGEENDLTPKLPNMPEIPDNATLVNKGADVAHDHALDFVRDQTDLLPFKSIIRSITGANQHAKKVDKARHAGQLRRAYLKGLAQAKFGKACLAPPPPALEVKHNTSGEHEVALKH